MSTTISQQTLEQFITNKLNIDKILHSEAHRYDISESDFCEADENDDSVLEIDEMLNEDTGVYEKLATLYQQELRREEQEAKDEEKKKEEDDEARATANNGGGV